jgi:hypothetical protein
MNHFFAYVKGDVKSANVFYDSDFVEDIVDETENSPKDETPNVNETPEFEEASRFMNGENIAFEEVFLSGVKKVQYIAYLHTRREINVDKLRTIIANEIEKRMREDFVYKLTVEKDSTTYSKSNQDYIVKIET